jgi:hypothetical protein
LMEKNRRFKADVGQWKNDFLTFKLKKQKKNEIELKIWLI